MEDENKQAETADSEKRERLVRDEKIAKTVSYVQWGLALVCLLMSASRFSNDGMGRLGGVMMLAAAWVVSPIVTNLDALKKLSFVPKLIIQAVLAAALFAGGFVIASQSAGNIDEAPAQSQAGFFAEI